jgi:hypothetical protein
MVRSFGFLAAMLVALWAAGGSAEAQTLVSCAREGGFCRVPYPTQVVYGVPGSSTTVEVRGRGIPCSNEVFGDPAYGVPKRCAYVARGFVDEPGYGHGYGERPRGPGRVRYGEPRYGEPDDGYEASAWRTCASENGFCPFRGVRRVRYGAAGRYVEGTYRGGTACSNSVFGDPVPGRPKVCQVLD